MKVYKDLKEIDSNYKNAVLAIGTFDGLHRGHTHLLQRAKELSEATCSSFVVFTFNNIPKILDGESAHKLIFENAEREDVLSDLGVDCLVATEFTRELKATSKEDFISLMLTTFSPCAIVLGGDFRFGKGAEGTAQWLKENEEHYGISVEVVDFLVYKDQKISSRDIRDRLMEGDISEVNKMLGRNYFIGGRVIHGNKLGRELGFKTANIDVGEHKRLPKNGVYITRTTYNSNVYSSISNVGVKPTVSGKKVLVETHIFDFDADLYGQDLKVEFLEKIRDEVKFESLDELVDTITRDVEVAIEYFKAEKGIKHESYSR